MTPSELHVFLNRLAAKQLTLSTMIWGPPGVGKSSIVRSVAAAQGMQCVDLRLSQLAPTDLRGLPVPKEMHSTWLPPDFLPRDGRGILFLDEINMAAPAVQGVAQQLVLDRRVGQYQLPDGWLVWAAGNRKEDRAAVYDMPAALANRFVHLEVDPSLDDFRRYALQMNLDEMLIAFLNFRPQLLHKFDAHQLAWPSPRSWEMADKLLSADLPIAPAVGEGPAKEFEVFRSTVAGIPDLDGVLKGQSDIQFPQEPSLRYAVVIGLISRARDATSAFHAFSWLAKEAASEWVQLFASEMFPLLRQRGQLGSFSKKVIKEPALSPYLTNFTSMLLD